MCLKIVLRKMLSLFPFLFFFVSPGFAQTLSSNGNSSQESALVDSVRRLEFQVQQLQSAIGEIKTESERYRAETLELKRELQATREAINAGSHNPGPAENSSAAPAASLASEPASSPNLAGRVSKLEEDQQLLGSKIDQQHQSSIETASKYHMRFSGILLMDVFSNKGHVDHLEVPGAALPANPAGTASNTGGSFASTLRQSQVALEIFGPNLAGAKTRADFVADFFGEPPDTINGGASSDLRLRTGAVHMDWKNTSLVAGMESTFFSPLYATSYASLGIPAFSYSGSLWGWFPQVRVERRFKASETSTITLSGGILDPLTGETPPNEFLRFPGAGENSRQPGYATRLEWSRRVFGQPLAIGIGGYYNRENWGLDRNIDGWAVSTDWDIPFGSRFRLSGETHVGRAIGGLGGAIGRSVVFDGPLSSPSTTISPLSDAGGWAQFKYIAASKLEFNVAAGQDGTRASDLRGFTLSPGYFPANILRNRSEMFNMIYRPRSNLLFSTEFRTLRTYRVDSNSDRANQLSLLVGVFF